MRTRLANEYEMEFLGDEDFFAPTDLGFVTQPTTVAPATAPAAPPAWQPLAKTFTEQWQRAGIDPMMSGINRAEELARILSNYGITDLSKLGLKDVSYTEYQPEMAGSGDNAFETGVVIPVERAGRQLTYGDKAFGYLGGFGSKGQEEFGTRPFGVYEYMQDPNLLAWSAAGHGNVSYRAVQAPNGQVYILPQWGSSSDWGEAREIARMAAVVASMGGAGAALGASLLPAGVSTAISGALGIAPTAVSTAVGNAILGGVASGKPKGALLGGVASLLAPVVTSQITQMLPVEITSTAAIDNLIKETAKNVTNAAVKSLITTGDMPNIEGIVQNTLLNEAGAKLQDLDIIPASVDVNKLVRVAETVNKMIGGGDLKPSELFGLVTDIGSSLPKTPGEKTPAGAATEPTAITAGEEVETLPGEDEELDYEQIAAGLPADLVMEQRYEPTGEAAEQNIDDILYGIEPGATQEPLSQQELEDYVKQITAPQEVTDQDIEDILQSIAVTSEPLPAGTMEDVPFLGETIPVTAASLRPEPIDFEFAPYQETPFTPAELPEDILRFIETPPPVEAPAPQVVEVTGERKPEPIDFEFISPEEPVAPVSLPPAVEELLLNPPAPQVIEVTGKRELDQQPLDVFETETRPDDVNLTDLVNTGPEMDKRGEEEQRIEIPGKKLQDVDLVPLDAAFDAATKLPEDIVKLIENPPAPQIVEVVGKKEFDQPPLDVFDFLFGKTDTRTDDINLTDLINTGPEEDKRGEETQRVDVTAKKPAVSPIDIDFNIKEPGPLVEPPAALPPELEKLITTPPAITPAPAPAPKPAPAPAPKPPATAKKDDLSWLFALLGMLGGQQQKPEPYQVADVRGARSPFGSLLDEAGSQDDLLRILRG